MKKYIFVLFFLLFSAKLFCQFDTAAFRNTPGSFYTCSFDSSEIFKDTIVFSKYTDKKSAFIVNWEKRCPPIDMAPYIFFQPGNDSIIYVYEKNVPASIDGISYVETDPVVVRGTWHYGKNKSIVEANFPAWKTDLTWKVEDQSDCWIFINQDLWEKNFKFTEILTERKDASFLDADTVFIFNDSPFNIPDSLHPPKHYDIFLLPKMWFQFDSVFIYHSCYYESPEGKKVHDGSKTKAGYYIICDDRLNGTWKILKQSVDGKPAIIEFDFPKQKKNYKWRIEVFDKFSLLIREP